MSSNSPTWVPEIMYEEASDNEASQLPFINFLLLFELTKRIICLIIINTKR